MGAMGARLRQAASSAARGLFRGLGRRAFPTAEAASEHWLRAELNRSIASYLDALPVAELRCAEIAGANHAGRPWGRFENLDYPDFDVCAPVEEPQRFDVVICEQVLEHVEDPWAAAENLGRLAVPGGHVIVSTPFLIKVHELPEYGLRDYWRFTPRGLRLLLERGGLEVARVESWGNHAVVLGNLDGWAARRPWHPMRNVPDVPVQVWAFARAPASA